MSRLLFQALIISKLICEANAIRSSKRDEDLKNSQLYLINIPVGCSAVIEGITKEYKEILKIDIKLSFMPEKNNIKPSLMSFSSDKQLHEIIRRADKTIKTCAKDGVRYVIPSTCRNKNESIKSAQDQLQKTLGNEAVEVFFDERNQNEIKTKLQNVGDFGDQIEKTRTEISKLCNLPV